MVLGFCYVQISGSHNTDYLYNHHFDWFVTLARIILKRSLLVFVECSSSVVEWRTCNRESPGSNPPFAIVSKFGHFRSLHDVLVEVASPNCINEHLAIDGGGNVNSLRA